MEDADIDLEPKYSTRLDDIWRILPMLAALAFGFSIEIYM